MSDVIYNLLQFVQLQIQQATSGAKHRIIAMCMVIPLLIDYLPKVYASPWRVYYH